MMGFVHDMEWIDCTYFTWINSITVNTYTDYIPYR